jgi:lipopolysaccharide/colanic/teichoic acid biosynthesis glycosyltransferase
MSYASSSSAPERLAERGPHSGYSSTASALTAKRLYDVFFSAIGLVVLSPLFLVIVALNKLADGGTVFYRQLRIGLHGQPFWIWKFRTMAARAEKAGPLVTCDGDTRVTKIGRILRKTKLDELPQLWNVLQGEMSLVGPRPEVPKYVGHYTSEQRQILNFKPGITDLASVVFRNEEMLLKNADNVEEFYIRHCIPRKLQLNLQHAEKANLLSDTWVILQTICPYWICLLPVYSLVLVASFWLSCQLVYDFSVPSRLDQDLAGTMCAVVALQLGALIWRKQCKGLLSYFSLPELRQVVTALGLACLLLLGLRAITNRPWPPQNLILVDALLSLCAISGFRLLFRFWRESSSSEETDFESPPVRVGIIGAGAAGSQIVRGLMGGKQLGRTVVAFFDDDCQKWHRRIHEIPVVGMPECLLDGWATKLDEVIIALPAERSGRIREIHQLLQQVGLRAYTAPSAQDLWLRNGNNLGEEARS